MHIFSLTAKKLTIYAFQKHWICSKNTDELVDERRQVWKSVDEGRRVQTSH